MNYEAVKGLGIVGRYGLEDFTSAIEDNDSVTGYVGLPVCELRSGWRRTQGDSRPSAGRPS